MILQEGKLGDAQLAFVRNPTLRTRVRFGKPVPSVRLRHHCEIVLDEVGSWTADKYEGLCDRDQANEAASTIGQFYVAISVPPKPSR